MRNRETNLKWLKIFTVTTCLLLFIVAIVIATKLFELANNPLIEGSDESSSLKFYAIAMLVIVASLVGTLVFSMLCIISIDDASYNLEAPNVSRAPSGFWTCPNCGSFNASFIDICDCGQKKPSKNQVQKIEKPTGSPKYWECPNCGKINADYVGTCGCGAVKVRQK